AVPFGGIALRRPAGTDYAKSAAIWFATRLRRPVVSSGGRWPAATAARRQRGTGRCGSGDTRRGPDENLWRGARAARDGAVGAAGRSARRARPQWRRQDGRRAHTDDLAAPGWRPCDRRGP